jgi:hypothetical protein
MGAVRGPREGGGAALTAASEERLALGEGHEEMVADDRFSVHDASVGAVRIAWRVLALLVVAVAYLVLASAVVWSAKPQFVPSVLLDAQMRAMADATEHGDESVCGIAILSASEGSGSATGTLWAVDIDTVTHATCLHERGYLDDAGLAAVLAFDDQRQWRSWEALLVGIGFVVVVGSASVLLFGRRRRGGPRYPSVSE